MFLLAEGFVILHRFCTDPILQISKRYHRIKRPDCKQGIDIQQYWKYRNVFHLE